MKLSIINHPEMGEIRTTIVKGEPWFVAKDICDVLSLVFGRSSVRLLDNDEKGVHTVDTPGGKQEMTIVNESGLYNLIFQSRKPEAKAFRKWVTLEVLPAIRKQGFYVHPSAKLSAKETREIKRAMLNTINKYLTGEDIYKCSQRFRVKEPEVRCVLMGTRNNNEILVDLQDRAIANRGRWVNGLDAERMQTVIKKINTLR